MKINRLQLLLLLALLLAAISCGDDVKDGDGDTSSDSDSTTDSLSDTNSSSDTATNTNVVDTGSDTAVDSNSDSVVDTQTDTAVDTATDTTVDTATDTAVDTATEVVDPATALENLITVFCQWEFDCCTDGERAYRLSSAYSSVEVCVSRLLYELNESNDTNMPLHLTSSGAMAVVPQIAYTVDLDRVVVNAAGVAACAQYLAGIGCNQPADPSAVSYCEAGVSVADANPCALHRMFNPGLSEGDICTNDSSLFEGMNNDIECAAGTSCVPPGQPGNSSNQAMCINRGIENEPCVIVGGQDNCDFNFFCNAAGVCAPKANAGESCTYDSLTNPVFGNIAAPCKPGLTCNPTLDTSANGAGLCVAPCSANSVCMADFECPEGQSCAPITVGNNSTGFSACRVLGSGATHRCDSHSDCVATSYCNASGVCAPDAAQEADCTVNEQCPAGTYCDGVCTAFTLNGSACIRDAATFESPQCSSTAVGCIYDDTKAGTICSTAKMANGAVCLADYDCASGLCEVLDTGAVAEQECFAGNAVGQPCDDNPTTFASSRARCAAGLECDATTHVCFKLLGPGEDCEAINGGGPDLTVCATGCADTWGEYLCTDGPVDVLDGGTGVVCDGNV